MIVALVTAVFICAIVLLVAWLLVVLIGVVPIPAPMSGVLPTVIWVSAIIICLFIMLRALLGVLGPLP